MSLKLPKTKTPKVDPLALQALRLKKNLFNRDASLSSIIPSDDILRNTCEKVDFNTAEFTKLVGKFYFTYQIVKSCSKKVLCFSTTNRHCAHLVKISKASPGESQEILNAIFTIIFSLSDQALDNLTIKIDSTLGYRGLATEMERRNSALWNKFHHPLKCALIIE